MFDPNYKFTVVERFLQYVKYDTKSDEESQTFPSDPKQLEYLKRSRDLKKCRFK
jgi:tripeptide aminopeptidase